MNDLRLKGPFRQMSPKSISDDFFEYDARLTIDGDWPSEEHKAAYLHAVIDALNAAAVQPAAPQVTQEMVDAAFEVACRYGAKHLPWLTMRAALAAALKGEGA